MENSSFAVQWPGKLVFGPGRLAVLGDEAKTLGRRAFVATTRDLSGLGLTDRVRHLLEAAGVAITLYEDVQPDPTSVAVDGAATLARAAGCDLIIGLGGGSAIDLAKGVAVAATHPGPIWDYVTYTGANAKPVTAAALPVIAIPTTAGTGSEVTLGTVLDNPRGQGAGVRGQESANAGLGTTDRPMKAALLSPHIYPRVALVDPELTYTMPPKVTAMTGFDALTHGMEAYLNAVRRNPASDLFALEAVRLVVHYLPQVLADPADQAARAQMAWAATLGGLSIALSNTTVAHAMGLPMGARLGTPHGLALSRLLPVVLAHSWQAQPARFAALAEAIGSARPGQGEAEKAQALAPWLKRFVEEIRLGAPWTGLGEAVEASSVLDTLTDDVFAYMGRPVQQHLPVFTRTEMRQMYEEALLR